MCQMTLVFNTKKKQEAPHCAGWYVGGDLGGNFEMSNGDVLTVKAAFW